MDELMIFEDAKGQVFVAVDIQLTKKEAISKANRYFHKSLDRLTAYRTHLDKKGALITELDCDARENGKAVWCVKKKKRGI